MKAPYRAGAGRRRVDPEAAQEAARALAVAALTFIASDPEELGRFLSLTGIGPESIRTAAREPGFLLGVLDHIAGNETLLVAFANQNEFDPDDIERARHVLSGADDSG